ncbi:hypothetical protein [Yinghuangia aomiensis]
MDDCGPGDDSDTDVAAGPSSASLLLSAAPATPCPALGAKDHGVPALAPAGVTWSLYHESLLPMSESAGSVRAEGDVVRCFARTPIAALLATAQISARYSFSDNWKLLMERSLAPGPERDAARTVRASAEAAAATSQPSGTGTVMQLVAFKFVSYTDDAAAVELMRGTDGDLQLVSALYTVKWVNGGWRLQVQASGAQASMVQKESSLSGFTPWQAGGS